MLLIPPLLATTLLLASPTHALQIPFLATGPTSPPGVTSPRPDQPPAHTFTLRHAFHAPTDDRQRAPSRLDYSERDLVSISALSSYSTTQSVQKTKRVRTQRPSSQEAFHAARRASFAKSSRSFRGSTFLPTRAELQDEWLASTLEWEDTEIVAPDTDDVDTLAAIGKMTSNAYTTPDASGWYDIGGGWNRASHLVSTLPLLYNILIQARRDRRILSVGRNMGSEGTFSQTRRTRRSSSRSKARALSLSEVVQRRARTTRST